MVVALLRGLKYLEPSIRGRACLCGNGKVGAWVLTGLTADLVVGERASRRRALFGWNAARRGTGVLAGVPGGEGIGAGRRVVC